MLAQLSMAFFVLLEFLRPVLLPLGLLLLVLAVAFLIQKAVRRGPLLARRPLAIAAGSGLLVAVVGVFAIPASTHATMGDLVTWTDWLALAGGAGALGALAFLVIYAVTLLLLTHGRR